MKLSIIINQELVFELARLGDSVRVIAPQTLADKLTHFLQKALQRYLP
ncbi:WYL domain-containing protein [Larkinella knui]|nr:WYL domain-containing protein [Larkinella knui]